MQEKKENIIIIFLRRFIILKNFLSSGIKIFFLKPYWKDRIIVNIIRLSVLLNVCLWVYLYRNKIGGSYPVILHYNLIFGVDYREIYSKIYLIPKVGLAIIVFNAILSYMLYSKEKLAAYFLTFNIFITQILLLWAGYLILKVNS